MNMKYDRIEYEASPEIRAVIANINRTEDIKLSPDNNRLAIVDFICNRIFLFTIRMYDIADETALPYIEILDYVILSSDSLHNPHGVAFLGNDHLIVCNRGADVCLFELPTTGDSSREYKIKPQKVISGKGMLLAKVKTPGSVDCYELGNNRYRVLICNNHWHFVSSHEVSLDKNEKIINRGTLIQNSLKIPDGVSISHDRAWIAISNHVYGEILIFANNKELDRKTLPVARLKGIVCPHGVRFTRCGKVLVADASSPYLHIFENNNGRWDGEHYCVKSLRIMDDDTFYEGRYDPREGGLKGIDSDASGRVLVTTHRLGILEFYDLRALLSSDDEVDREEMIKLCRERDQSIVRQRGKKLNQEWTLKSRVLWTFKSGPQRALRKLRKTHQRLIQYSRRTP